MEFLPDAPAAVLLALTLAAALFLVEVALPTVGVAGTLSLVLAVWAVAIVDHQGYAWWPLLLVVAGVCVWAALLMRRAAGVAGQGVAAGLFFIGATTYGVLAGDTGTVLLGVLGAAGLSAGFRPLLGSTRRLLEMPQQTGMESLVGRTATVVAWSRGRGTVRIDGSLWNARGPAALSLGTDVVVRGFERMTVEVAALGAAIP